MEAGWRFHTWLGQSDPENDVVISAAPGERLTINSWQKSLWPLSHRLKFVWPILILPSGAYQYCSKERWMTGAKTNGFDLNDIFVSDNRSGNALIVPYDGGEFSELIYDNLHYCDFVVFTWMQLWKNNGMQSNINKVPG